MRFSLPSCKDIQIYAHTFGSSTRDPFKVTLLKLFEGSFYQQRHHDQQEDDNEGNQSRSWRPCCIDFHRSRLLEDNGCASLATLMESKYLKMCSSKRMSKIGNFKIHSSKSFLSSPKTTNIPSYNASTTHGSSPGTSDETKHTPLQVLTLPTPLEEQTRRPLPRTLHRSTTLVRLLQHPQLPKLCPPPNHPLAHFDLHHIYRKEFLLVVSPSKVNLINNYSFHTHRPTSILGLDMGTLTNLTQAHCHPPQLRHP